MKRYILLLICLIGLRAASASSQYWDGNIYNVGRYSNSFTFQTTYDAEEIGTGLNDEVFFKFTLTQPMQLTFSSLGSEVEDTYFLLYKGNIVIAQSDGAEGSEQAYLEKSLPAGEYELSVTKYNTQKKNITISIQGKYNNSQNTFIIGSFDKEFSYKETKNTAQYANSYGLSSSDVIYDFTTFVPFDLFVTATSASESQTGKPQIYLLNSSRELVVKGLDGWISHDDLPAGNYYVVVEGAKGDGEITTKLEGTYCFPEGSYDVGSYDKPFTFSSEESFDSYPNILGNELGDIPCRIDLKVPMTLTIRHNSDREEHTAIHLWNANLVEIGNSETHPSNIPNAHPGLGTLQMNLPAGSYCIISEALDSYTDDLSRNLTIAFEGSLPGDMPADTTQNYIFTRTMTAADGSSFVDKVEYYDGLGRPVETVQRKGGGNGEDLVSFLEYDAFGRESNSWLPRAKVDGQGLFVPFDKFKLLSPELYGNDTKAYTKPKYENSPLSRIIEKYGPGEEWHNSGKSVKQSFLTNIEYNDTLNCMLLKVEDEWTTDTLVTLKHEKNYLTGELSVTRTTDEDGNRTFEFRDKLGRIVLNRRMEGNAAYDTYFIYNLLDAPIAVLPPAAAELLKSSSRTSWSSNSDDALSQYAYFYKYDSSRKQLCRAKKLPGCAWTFYLYDKSNRLIFTQDGNMRQRGEWHFNLPDINGRTCLTGICKNPLNAMDPFLPLFSTLVTVKHDTSANFGYRIANDAITLTDAVILSVNFYDNYGFMSPDEYTGSTYFSSPHLSYNAESGFDNRYYTDHAEGLPTGTLTAELDGSVVRGYLPSVNYYDYRGNVVQCKSGNHLIEGFEKEYFANNFTGAPLKRKHVHTATGQVTQTELYSYRYDHRGSLLEVSHQLNSNPAVNLLSNRYDALGRLISKKQHGAVETTNYAYNIRSWLTEINSKRFNQKLFYNDGNVGIRPLYNGNISAMRWSLSDERFSRFYKFRYDNLNRMTAAIYSESSDRANDNRNYYETQPDYTEYIDEYDKQGNIKKLTRYGLSKYHHSNAGTTYGFDEMDNLTLDYSGNQLQKVSDAATDPFYEGAFNFVDGNKTNDIEYKYDANGNLTQDFNKKIAKIQYNILNLPSALQFTEGHTSEYLYDAAGVKRKVKQVTTTENLLVPMGSMLPVPTDKVAITTQTDYCGNVIYENGTLSRILVDGGYITMSGTTPTYHYYIQDHQGNNRVVFNQNGTIEQANHYYPFGMTFGEGIDSSDNRYKYNGKELDRMHGLDLYDYGARHYDAAIGRWGVMDPLAEKYYSVSPYAYCMNNPINYIDMFGLWNRSANGYATSDPKDIEQFCSYLSVETTVLNNAPTINQMDKFVEGTMSDNRMGTLSDGSKLVPSISVDGYKINNNIQWAADSKSFDTAWYSIQGDLTPYALDPRTLNHNIIGSYPGPNNPKKYCGQDDYSYVPTNPVEIPAMIHDLEYDKLKIRGSEGLLNSEKSIPADWRFVMQEMIIGTGSINPITRFQGQALGIGLGVLVLPKTLKYLRNK